MVSPPVRPNIAPPGPPRPGPAVRTVLVLALPLALALARPPEAAWSRTAGAGGGSGPGPIAPAAFGRALDAWARPLVEGGWLSGQVVVSRDGTVLAERAWGLAHRELGAPVTPETRFCIASITKPMTGILATRLAEEGLLSVSDSIARWFPGFPGGERIRVDHLLRHRSGIPHRVTTDCDVLVPRSAADMVEFASRATPAFEPGEGSLYSSAGYSVLARVLEIQGGADYATLLERRLCGPLGMTRTLHPPGRGLLDGRAASYVPGPAGPLHAKLEDLSYLVGAGSVWSTARDVHALVRAVVTGRLGATVRASWVRGGRLAWNGSTNGFRAWADWDSATGIAAVFTGNYHTGATDLLRAAVAELAAGRAVPPAAIPAPRVIALDAAAARGIEGRYDVAGNTGLELRATDGGFTLGDWPLLPTGPDTFFSPRDFGEVRVVRGAGGAVERLDWKQGDRSFPCPRTGDLPER